MQWCCMAFFLFFAVKKILLFFLLTFSLSTFSQVTLSVSAIEMDQPVTITVDTNSSATDCNGFTNPTKVYMHAGIGNNSNAFEFDVVGNWGQDDGIGEMTNNNDGTFSITITPQTYFTLTQQEIANATRIGMVFRNENGSQEFKDNGCQDFIFPIGAVQINIISPTNNPVILNSGDNLPITATIEFQGTTVVQGSIEVFYNNVSQGSANCGFPNCNFTLTNITESGEVRVVGTPPSPNQTQSGEAKFNIVVAPTVTEAPVPNGMLDGINLDPNDNTKATLVFYAPGKDFVYLIGDFNNWTIDNAYLLKKDPSNDRFWIELTGLTPQNDHMYQYLVNGTLRVADPYSTLILDEYEDQYIDNTRFPNLPSYPHGSTNHAVTWLRTGDTEYNWQVPNFQPPKKTDLMIYELLIRDFDSDQTFDAVKSRLDYLQNLGINAIEFMPLNEFDGNLSWGYNPSFHMAFDKYYGSPTAFKQLVDECHARGMAVIVDVVFNHASGQNPFYRMWNSSNGGYGGSASNDSPFFNASAPHDFSVFNDFNHESQATQDYVKRVTQYWIEEYNIDGFRWDLSKGFTQTNSVGNIGLWNSYDATRVNLLKEYADYQWDKNPDFYVILEHFADNSEETDLINYRLNEGKGMMVWGNMHGTYKEAALGYHENNKSNFSWISYKNRGWTAPQNVGFMVSHDEERLVYENLNYGNSSGSYDTSVLSTALDRMELAGAFFFTIPGPKMIWQFDELGYDYSINYCPDGSIKNDCRTSEKPIRWDYESDVSRKDVYNTWSKLIQLKTGYDIFETSDFTLDVSNINGLKRIHLTDTNASDLQHLTIIGNFGVTQQNIVPDFQVTGTWYDLLNNNSSISVTSTSNPITLGPGEFKVYGNMPVSLSAEDVVLANENIVLYPNPASGHFSISKDTKEVVIFDVTGKEVKSFKHNKTQGHQFEVSELTSGIYFVKITTASNQRTIQKIIIN